MKRFYLAGQNNLGNRGREAPVRSTLQLLQDEFGEVEICYPAQGFQLFDKHADVLDLGDKAIPTTRLMTKLNQRQEPVTYWTVVGDHVTVSGIDKKLTEMRYAMADRMPDGMLIRVSSIDGAVDHAYQNQDQFARAVVTAIASADRERFSGNGKGRDAPRKTP